MLPEDAEAARRLPKLKRSGQRSHAGNDRQGICAPPARSFLHLKVFYLYYVRCQLILLRTNGSVFARGIFSGEVIPWLSKIQ
jgi:hypothetical protein